MAFQPLVLVDPQEQDLRLLSGNFDGRWLMNAGAGQQVAVFGAYGYTGRFVVAELQARGLVPVLSGRDPAKLQSLATAHPGLDARPATVADPASLDRALAGVAAVINCAGPFIATSGPLVEAALRAGIHYVDVAAEPDVVANTMANFGDRARVAGVTVVPAMAFYGGLGDLLVTAAMGDWTTADEAHIAFGMDSWHPTQGTRNTIAQAMQRSQGRRACHSEGHLQLRDGEPPMLTWKFPEPMGEQKVIGEFNFADVVTVPSHLNIPEVCCYLPVEAIGDVMAPDTPPPTAVDERGRSAQTFIVDAVVRSGGEERRASARGQDAYAASAPLAVEAVRRVLSGATNKVGVASAGAIFDAPDFLRSLAPDLTLEFS